MAAGGGALFTSTALQKISNELTKIIILANNDQVAKIKYYATLCSSIVVLVDIISTTDEL